MKTLTIAHYRKAKERKRFEIKLTPSIGNLLGKSAEGDHLKQAEPISQCRGSPLLISHSSPIPPETFEGPGRS